MNTVMVIIYFLPGEKKPTFRFFLCTKCKLMHQINHIVIELSFFQGVPGLEGRKGNKGEIGEKVSCT